MAPRAASRLETLGFRDVRVYRDGKLDWMAAGLPVEGENSTRPRAGDVARRDVTLCGLGDRVGDVSAALERDQAQAAVVVDDTRVVLGLLRASDLDHDPDARVEDAMTKGPSTFRPHVPIKEMADYMTEHDLETSPVTTAEGRLVGLLLRSDAVREAEGCPDCTRRML
jgi:CBS domain-containing protein